MSAVRHASNSASHTRRRAVLFGGLLLVFVAVLAALRSGTIGPSSEVLLEQARACLERQDFAQAETIALQVLRREPKSASARLVSAQAAVGRKRFEAAMSDLNQIADDDETVAVEARCLAGDIYLLHWGQLSAAEAEYRRALNLDATSVVANDHLAFTLGLASRNWEQIPLRLRLIRLGHVDPVRLYSLCLGEVVFENDNLVESYYQASPEDPLALLGMARYHAEEQRFDEAEALLRQALSIRPDLTEARARLGQLLLHRDKSVEFLAWHATLPAAAEGHPAIWTSRGRWAQRHGQLETAARCYWEALRRDANHELAHFQLGQVLIGLGRAGEAAPFFERARRLQDYVNLVKVALEFGGRDTFFNAAVAAEKLGLVWEAFAWYRFAAGGPRVVEPRSEAIRPLLPREPVMRNRSEDNPALRIDLVSYPLPDWMPAQEPVAVAPERNRRSVGARLRFRQDATGANLNFRYHNGGDPARQGIRRMYEFTGGGIAVLDFDRDGWPDLYNAQGGRWPPAANAESSQHNDQLARNLGQGQFADVATAAGIREFGFSQGVTCGDFDQDGFPDIYVGNIGGNRFFRNQGDGTFEDVTTLTGTAGDAWTSSCALADLDGDGLPDLYVVNYLEGPDVFTRVCSNGTSQGTCMPQHFSAAPDRLYQNLGDGRFREISREAGILRPDGKGLGIVIADFHRSGRKSIFVANDSTPNFYFMPANAGFAYHEEAFPRGLAVDESGRNQACMGVAAGDGNGDGRLDLFVTNFYLEFNTFYAQHSSGQFEDATRAAKLAEPSLRMLGFGTQFLDADRDGDLDLVVANGHIGDQREQGIPFPMRPQLFENRGDGTYREMSKGDAGPYFEESKLGRSVVRCDWNRDGLEDLVVSHLDAPTALLSNVSHPEGSFLTLQLVGVRGEREAIGARVEVRAGANAWTRDLVAGDGYMASNDRRLHFATGNASLVDEVRVTWPAGSQQVFPQLPTNEEYVLVENDPVPARRAR